MKKTLILTDRFYPEDFPINEFLAEFTKRGIRVEVLTQEPSYPFGKVSSFPGYRNRIYMKEQLKEAEIYRIWTVQGYKGNKFMRVLHNINFVMYCSLLLLFLGWRYDRIFVYQTGTLTMALPALLAKIIFRCRVIIWTCDIWPDTVYALVHKETWWLRKLMDFVVGLIYSRSDEIFVSSRGFIPRINKYAPGKTIYFMPQWQNSNVNIEHNHGDVRMDPGLFHFTFTGNIGLSQNLETVIKGFALAVEQVTNIQLNIVGDGNNLDKIKMLSADKAIKGIVFWGRRPKQEMPAIYSQSDVLLISLKPDPLFEMYLPFKIISYLQARKPILAVTNGEVSNLVKEFNIGLTADPSSPESVSKAMLQFCAMDLDQRSQLSARMESMQKEIFDTDKILKQFFTVFSRLSSDSYQTQK